MQYAIIYDGIIVNVAIIDNPDFASVQGWILLDNGFWIGDLWDAERGFSKAL